MNARITLPILLALIAAHVVLAIGFATQTPWRTGGLVRINPSVERDIGAPDERQHANYIGRLARGEGLPVFNANDPNLYENYQAHQPPLYYALGAAWSKLTGVSDIERREDGLRLRALNIVIGAAAVAGVFFAAWWATRSDAAALGAAAFAALIPMNLALSGAVSNDPLLICLCTWTLAVTAVSVREGWTVPRAASVGVLVGLALLTKTTALALLPVLLIAVILKRPAGKAVLAAALPILVLAGPWLARNQSLYGDPFAIKEFNRAFTQSAQKEFMVTKVIPRVQPEADPETAYWKDWVGYWSARSFVGVFGYMDIWLTPNGTMSAKPDDNRLYWLVLAILGVAGIVGLRGFGDAKARSDLAIFTVFGIVIVALFVQFNRQYFQAQGRYVYPALAVWATFIGLGLSAWKKRPLAGVALLAIVLVGIDTLALTRLGGDFSERVRAGRTAE